MRAIEPAWHEYAANLLFSEDGLAPYFAADSRIKDGGGSQHAEFEVDGERWVAELYFQDSGIVHPGRTMPSGTEFRLETVREFRLHVSRHSEEDTTGQQSFNVHPAPRWQGMTVERDKGTRFQLDVPSEMDEGVNVRIQGSNIDAFRYAALLQRAAEAVGVSMGYFENPLAFSNTQDAEWLFVDEMNPRVVMQVGGWDSFQAIELYLNAPTPDVADEALAETESI